MPQPDALFLEHMLQALDRIEELLARTTREDFDKDWVAQDALIRELEIVGEAAEVRPLIEKALDALSR